MSKYPHKSFGVEAKEIELRAESSCACIFGYEDGSVILHFAQYMK